MVINHKTHEQRIKEQVRQYHNIENIHAQLPDIFSYWQSQYFKPAFVDIFEVHNHLEFYSKPFFKSINETGCTNVVSLGCGDAHVEVGVASGLKRSGLIDFRFYCVELSPAQIDRAQRNVEKAGLADNFVFVEADFNSWNPEGREFAGAMCHHALHHVLELEYLVRVIRRSLHARGVFCLIDVIGRNGHMRWPEALEIIDRLWKILPDEKKYHHILKRVDLEYVNHDCSTQGFEGIRAQDILPLLVDNFKFESFFAFGNLIDVFTNRGFGVNYSAQNNKDVAFIDFVQYLNELLIDLGYLKPTRVCAVMRRETHTPPKVYKNWTPEYCIRHADPTSRNATGMV